MSTTSSSEPGVTGTSHPPIEGCARTFKALIAPGINKPSQALMTGKTKQRLASRRDSLVTCESCGRRVERQMRGQKYCSARCRDLGRGRCRKKFLGQDTGAPTTPTRKARVFNELDWAQKQSSGGIVGPQAVIETECFAPYQWRDEISPGGVPIKVTRFRGKR